MTEQTTSAPTVRVIGPQEGDRSRLGGLTNRFMIDGADTQSRFSLVEHSFDPRALAAPMHRHRNEDEYTFIVEGRMGAVLGDEEVFGTKGDLIFKPRGQWHTFWNAGDEPLVVLELISPAGLEQLFRSFTEFDGPPDPDRLAELAARYGCELDLPATFPVVERHGRRSSPT
jgi:mannose-6-phosphate isomerase-like protein (cupin superfamily)